METSAVISSTFTGIVGLFSLHPLQALVTELHGLHCHTVLGRVHFRALPFGRECVPELPLYGGGASRGIANHDGPAPDLHRALTELIEPIPKRPIDDPALEGDVRLLCLGRELQYVSVEPTLWIIVDFGLQLEA